MYQEAVNKSQGPELPEHRDFSQKPFPTPTLIKDASVYTPLTINRDAGQEKCSLVGHSGPRQ